MTLLDEIIDGATSDSLSTANLLRKVQVAATRLGATEIVAWVKNELNGYPSGPEGLPVHRAPRPTSVVGIFSGPMRSFMEHHLPQPANEDWDRWFEAYFDQPVAMLEAFASEDGDSHSEWPAGIVSRYEATGTFRMEFHGLFSAHRVLTRQELKGVIDGIRTAALEFALDLQMANPEAGTVGGPTVASDPEVAGVVYNITNNITGHGTNVAAGGHINQSSTVQQGDAEALRREAERVGLTEELAADFVSAVEEDQSAEGPHVEGFLDRLRSGAIELTTGIAVKVATTELTALAQQYLGTLM